MIGSPPVFIVSDFVAAFNQSLDVIYPEVLIQGELSNFRVSKGVWVYFDLQDEIASVKFFGNVRILPGPLEDGMLLEVAGRPYLHPKFGFSVQITGVRAIGKGSINRAYQMLNNKLKKEGLFDSSRKRALPNIPQKVGVITSLESAAYGDFTKVIGRRWPALKVELFDVVVQGSEAPGQIVRAIERANSKFVDLEVLVLIRGGGSREDLSAFDHESLVRTVAASRIPTLAAVGHERDVSLCELAADVRASTPSNAAEMLVPDRKNELVDIGAAASHMRSLLQGFSRHIHNEVEDYLTSTKLLLVRKYTTSEEFVQHAEMMLSALDPRQPLQRGYALVKNAEGTVIKTSVDAQAAGRFSLEFKDGIIEAESRKEA